MITIGERLRPFSHVRGTKCLIPGTTFFVEVFPALVRFYDLKEKKPEYIKEVAWEIEGPLDQFIVFQDLERNCVTVVANRKTYHLLPSLEISSKKHPEGSNDSSKERLSLGSHKKQEWEVIYKREDFRTIFPLWFRLGNLLKFPTLKEKGKGIFSVLDECQEKIDANHPEHILPIFRKLFLVGFSGMLVPRLHDEEYQGISLPNQEDPQISPLYLLSEGARLIRSLFFKAKSNQLFLLPSLPPEFFAGRMLHLSCLPFGKISLEWNKKSIKKAVFHASQSGILHFHLHPSLITFRVRTSLQDRGIRLSNGEGLEIKSNSVYLLDHFEK